MRIMMMHKNDPKTEADEPPPMDLVHKMGEFIGTYAQAGKFIDGGGLAGSKQRTRLTFKAGQATVKHGPYKGEHELPASAWILKVSSRDEAIGWAERYGKILGDGEIELGKLNEPWDIGLMPAPENPPLQMLLVEKEGAEHTAQQKAALSRLKTEMEKAGVFQRGYRLKASGQAKRLSFVNNALGIVDGPFTETKELIGGFSIMELQDFDECIELCKVYAEILGGTLEVDLRVVDQDAAA